MTTMLTIEQLDQLNNSYRRTSYASLDALLAEMGSPSDQTIILSALAGLKSKDRNTRALMLRVLTHYPTPAAMEGILASLVDDQRRVRDVAIQSSRNFLHYVEIASRLAEIVTDESEKRKIRSRALSVLAGVDGLPITGPLPQAAADALTMLMDSEPSSRQQILLNLIQLDLSPTVEALLTQFMGGGSEDEVALATQALAGYKVVNLGLFDDAKRAEIIQTCQLVTGRVYYWIER